jgi:hypothetical protein
VRQQVLLTAEPLTLPVLVAAFARHAPDLRVDTGSATELRLLDETGQLMVLVGAPLMVATLGEAERLLDTPSPPLPYYWTELSCGPSGAAGRLMAEIAATVRERLGGRLV